MPRVAINKYKYILKDAAKFLNGKTRGCGLYDKDMATVVGLSPPAYCQRKKPDKMELSYINLVKIIEKQNWTDEEIVKFMRGKF